MKKKTLIKRLGLAVVIATLAGCAQSPLTLPEQDIPENWHSSEADANAQWPAVEWWEGFGLDELERYMAEVRGQNLDLANSRHNLAIARINLQEAGLDRLPTPTAALSINQQLKNQDDDGKAWQSQQGAELGLTLSYSDILKKPATYRAALASYESQQAQILDTALETYRTAAQTYFQRLLIREKITTAENNLANAQRLLNIIEVKVENGTITSIDALQQRIVVEQQRNNLRSLRQEALAAEASLALLAGKNWQELSLSGESLEGVTVPNVQAGIPSLLLRRRPDLIQAAADVQAAHADVELAKLDYFPTISLTASAGASSDSLRSLLTNPVNFIDISVNLLQTLLDNGAIDRTNERAKLSLDIALNNYRKALLSAFNEVDVGLSNLQLVKSLAQVSLEDLKRAEEAYRIAEVRYKQGVADYQTLLSTQNSLFENRVNHSEVKLNHINAVIQLYIALGGGWDVAQDNSVDQILATD